MKIHVSNPGLRSRTGIQASLAAVSAAISAAVLVACGGGGGTDTGTPPVVTTKFTGVAATGAALAGAAVQAKCAVGAASGITAADGSYTIEITGATLPCVLSALSADGKTELRSLADPAGGNTQVIQINPVTELVVARLAAQDAGAFFTGFDAAGAAKINTAAIQTAIASVVGTLKGGGVDFTALGNPLTATLVPATGSTAGNAYDQALDALALKLRAASTTLPQLAAQVVAALPSTGAAGTVGLPPELLLRTAHADCAALRTGTYRIVDVYEQDPARITYTTELDAPTLTMRFTDGSKDQGVSEGGCAFTFSNGGTKVVVSQAGVLVVTTSRQGSSKYRYSLAFPEQAANLAALAGSWNLLQIYPRGSTPEAPLWDVAVGDISAAGLINGMQICYRQEPCVVDSGAPTGVKLHAQAGYEFVFSGAVTEVTRVFTYTPGSGQPMLVATSGNGALIGTQRSGLGLRSVGDNWATWELTVNAQGVVPSSFALSNFEVLSVDSVAQSYVRRSAQDGVQNTLMMNKPRTGFTFRAPGTATNSAGNTVNVSEAYSMPLLGTGVTVYGGISNQAVPSQVFFGASILRP